MQQGFTDEAFRVDGGRAAHAACDRRFPPAFGVLVTTCQKVLNDLQLDPCLTGWGDWDEKEDACKGYG